MKVLITGATGFVGRAALQRLLADGHEIRAAFHRAPPIAQEGVAWTQIGDLSDADGLRGLLEGSEIILHLAALAHQVPTKSTAEGFARVNRDGTAALAKAAAEAGARRFVFLSSVKACGERSVAGPLRETDAKQPMDPYGVSKSQAEDRLAEIAAGTGMESVVVRPPLVYGPGVRANFLKLMRWIDGGWPLPLASSANLRSMSYVGNLVDALARCISLPAAAGRTYFVSDGEDVSTAELARRMGVALGRPARVIPVPLPLLRVAAGVLGRRSAVDRLTGSLVVDISRIRGELGWIPPYSMMHGLEQTVAWYRRSHAAAGGRDV